MRILNSVELVNDGLEISQFLHELDGFIAVDVGGYDFEAHLVVHNYVETRYVISSGANVPFSGPETYIFPANVDGDIIDFAELPGSFRGRIDHEAAMNDFLNRDNFNFNWFCDHEDCVIDVDGVEVIGELPRGE